MRRLATAAEACSRRVASVAACVEATSGSSCNGAARCLSTVRATLVQASCTATRNATVLVLPRCAPSWAIQRQLCTAAEQSLRGAGIDGAYRCAFSLGGQFVCCCVSTRAVVLERLTGAYLRVLLGVCFCFRVWANGGGLVHAYAAVDSTAIVEPSAVVFPGARIGEGCRIGAGSVVGPGCTLGAETVLGYGVTISHARLGARCTLHHGVRLGADGFGFAVDAATGRVVKKPQTWAVVLGDDVEVGANTCIDRGSWRDTTLGDGTKVDNLVQIGHNAVVGKCVHHASNAFPFPRPVLLEHVTSSHTVCHTFRRCLLCGHVALGGSATLGDGVIMGGKSAVKDHVSVAAGVRIAAKSGVTANITQPGDYAGFPAMPAALWRRQLAKSRRC